MGLGNSPPAIPLATVESDSTITTPETPPTSTGPSEYIEVYNSDSILISLNYEHEPNNSVCKFQAKIITTSQTETFEDFQFQVAVPKTQQLQMLGPSSTVLKPDGDPITQV